MKKFSYFFVASMLILATLVSCNPTQKEEVNDLGLISTPSHSTTTGELSDEYAIIQKRSEKRGISFNSTQQKDWQLLGNAISWVYNWGASTSANFIGFFDAYGIKYYPMTWSGVNTGNLNNAYGMQPFEYILAFNEPNLTDQANMTPAEAAAKWTDLVNYARAKGVKIISPAMNYGTKPGYSDPVKWLDEFFAQPNVSLDDVDGIAIHCYMNNVGSLKSFVNKFAKYNKPIWLTEYCQWDNATDESQVAYLGESINYLENEPMVAKYCWFMLRMNSGDNAKPYNALIKNSSVKLTNRGIIYANASTFDKTAVYPSNKHVPAEHYSNCSGLNDSYTVKLSPSTDVDGELQLSSMTINRWVEYTVDIAEAADNFALRYACRLNDSMLDLYIDDVLVETITVANTGSWDAWDTITIKNKNIPSGEHKIKLAVSKGKIAINWFEFY